MARTSNRITKGTGVYTCRCCHRKTRDTGRGDNEGVGLCAECYDLSGEENHLSDTGKFYSSPEQILALVKAVTDKGGNALPWADIAIKANNLIKNWEPAPMQEAPTKKSTGPATLKQERIAKYVGRIVGKAAAKCAQFSSDAPLRIYVEIEFNNTFLDQKATPFPQAVKAELAKMGFTFA